MQDWISTRFSAFGERAIYQTADDACSYASFIDKIRKWDERLKEWNIQSGDRVGLIADYHIDVVALLISLMHRRCIVVPLSPEDKPLLKTRLAITDANKIIRFSSSIGNKESAECETLVFDGNVNAITQKLTDQCKAGLIIFTSGSTGNSKAVLLDFEAMTKKYASSVGRSFKTLLFLKLDHIGGLNTLFSVIFNGGTIVTSESRNVVDICRCIEQCRVELLPTTPSFLNMLLLSNMHHDFDLSSLEIVTYGTEVMPSSTLASINQIFPDVKIKQTYGLSELGILSTQSESSESKWMKLGGVGFKLRVVDDVLWIKSDQAMLGYLNAPSPFDKEGWYNTGDRVEVRGDYFNVLGRESEIINVAGEKVFPIEVENYLLTIKNVKDVLVREKKSPIVGALIWAEFILYEDEELSDFRERITKDCRAQMASFKVPGLITISSSKSFVGSRFKKMRTVSAQTA